MKPYFFLIGILVFSPLAAQEALDWDIDTIFDEPLPDDETNDSDEVSPSAMASVMRRGITFDASFLFQAGVAPGFDDVPWYSRENFSWYPGATMRADLGIDAQISEVFRVRNTVFFKIPYFNFCLGELFFDYNLFDVVFFRGGKYDLTWGISPNYSFTDLLSRLPNEDAGGDSYIIKADIPIGIGGLQALALTRADLISGADVGYKDFGYGLKYNLAFTWADFNLGSFYREGMPFRSFLSIKTTVVNTELYSEGLFAINVYDSEDYSGAANLGFVQDFFNGNFSVNGELFYNAEKDTTWFRPETNIRDAGPSPFVEGLNMAFNLTYRFGGRGNPRLYFLTRYTPFQNSAQLIPAFKFTPLLHVDVSLAVPMALGSKDEHSYYHNNEDIKNRPFSIVLYVTLTGDIKAGYFF